MDKPLGEHIRTLEVRLDALNRQMMEEGETRKERNRIEAEIRAVTLALAHYREAVTLEQGL